MKNLGLNFPHSPPFRPAPSPEIWLDFSSQPSAQLDFWFQPAGRPPSPLPPNSLLYPVSFPPPPLQFHNLTLNGVRGAGAGEGAEVAEENFEAPSAVEKQPIPSPSYFVVFFFFRVRGGSGFLRPRPRPGARSRSPRCSRTPDQGRDHGGDAWRGPKPVAPARHRVPFSSISGLRMQGRRDEGSANWAFISNKEGEARGSAGLSGKWKKEGKRIENGTEEGKKKKKKKKKNP